MKHNHRINPGHNGGEYTEGNVISVEVIQCDTNTASHAMWHYANWRLWGKHEDKVAWKALSGFWGQEEIIQETLRAGGMYAGKLPCWTDGDKEVRALESPGEGWHRGRSNQVKEKVSESRQGYRDTDEAKNNKSKASKGKKKSPSHRSNLKRHLQRPEVQERRKEGLAKANSQKWQCTVTGKVSTAGPLTLYQKSLGIDVNKRVKVNH
jgi:hypothetical protein